MAGYRRSMLRKTLLHEWDASALRRCICIHIFDAERLLNGGPARLRHVYEDERPSRCRRRRRRCSQRRHQEHLAGRAMIAQILAGCLVWKQGVVDTPYLEKKGDHVRGL